MVFSMEVIDTETIKNEIIEQVKPVPEEVTKIKELAENNVSEIMTLDLESLEKRKLVLKSIDALEWTHSGTQPKEFFAADFGGEFFQNGDDGVPLQRASWFTKRN